MTRATSFLIAFAMLDCGGDQTPPKNVTLDPLPTASSSSTRLAVAPIKIANAKEHTVDELEEDGTILFDGKPKGKIVGERIVQMDGKLVLSVNSDGSMTSTGFNGDTFVVKLNDKDEVVMPDGAKMFITDTGSVTLFDTSGALAPGSGNSTVLAFKPSTRRATSTIVFAMFMLEIHVGK